MASLLRAAGCSFDLSKVKDSIGEDAHHILSMKDCVKVAEFTL